MSVPYITGVRNMKFGKHALACGAGKAARSAFDAAQMPIAKIDYLGIYDSFTITLPMLLEETGFAGLGLAAQRVRRGDFSPPGALQIYSDRLR